MVELSKLLPSTTEAAAGGISKAATGLGKAATSVGKAVLVQPATGLGRAATSVGKAVLVQPVRRLRDFGGRNLTFPRSSSADSLAAAKNSKLASGSLPPAISRDLLFLKAENAFLLNQIKRLEAELAETASDLDKQRKLAGGLSRLRASNVTIGKELGEGAFGKVYRGQWRGVTCAIKFLQQSVADSLTKEFSIMDQFDHGNIVQLYGIVEAEPDGRTPASWPEGLQLPCLVMEYMGFELEVSEADFALSSRDMDSSGGSSRRSSGPRSIKVSTLVDYTIRTLSDRDSDPEYWVRICGMLSGAAKGMGYLHSRGFLHRDIKAVNLLLDARGDLKLADFGLATPYAIEQGVTHANPMAEGMPPPKASLLMKGHTKAAGTYTHMAPEVMGSGDYNAAADVFSFGVVITEVLAASEAEEIIDETRTAEFGLNTEALLRDYGSQAGEEEPPGIPERLIRLADRCCCLDPTGRPTADQIVGRLQQIQLEHQARRLKTVAEPTPPDEWEASMASMDADYQPAPEPSPDGDEDASPGGNETDPAEGAGADPSVRDAMTAVMEEMVRLRMIDPTVDPRTQEAARIVFREVDRNRDGHLHLEELQTLARVGPEGLDLREADYDRICGLVGAERSVGLSEDQVVRMYTELNLGDPAADLECLREARHRQGSGEF